MTFPTNRKQQPMKRLLLIAAIAIASLTACAPSPVQQTAPPRVDVIPTIDPTAAAFALATATGVPWHTTNWGALTTGNLSTAQARTVHGKLCATDWARGAVLFEGAAHATCPAQSAPPTTSASSTGWNPQAIAGTGGASFYDDRGVIAFPGSRSPIGCAHRTLPAGTRVKVVARSGASTECVVDDRGPYVSGRVIDLQPAQFDDLAPLSDGVVDVTLLVG